MTSISAINNSALLILQKAASSLNSTEKASGADLVAVANGRPAQTFSGVSVSTQPTRTGSKVAEDMFSVNSPNLAKLKIDLFERTGQALGIDKVDFASDSEYGAAIKKAVTQLKAQPDGQQVIAGIEQKLGLDKLGVSLDTLVNAIISPDGDDSNKLDNALEKQTGKEKDKDAADQKVLLVQPDDIGLYGVSVA